MRKKWAFDLDDADADAVCESQTLGAAGALTLDGAAVSGGVATFDIARKIGIASTANFSAVTFTVTGTDPDGVAQVVTLSGPNNNTVETDAYFKTITSVEADGALGTAVTVGTVDEACTQTIPLDYWATEAAALSVNVVGTINYTVQQTLNKVQDRDALPHQNAVWHDIDALAAKTADLLASAVVGATAVRLLVNSYTNGAEIELSVAQTHGR